ncbi:HAMP domain-containing sensor histidine kinase [Actinomycetes bacterium KLBMP 9759]
MRRRIVLMTVLVSTVAICLFALPFAAVWQRFYTQIELAELERDAHSVAADALDDLRDGEVPNPHWLEDDITAAIYSPNGQKLVGEGPQTADGPVRKAMRSDEIEPDKIQDGLVVAVPIYRNHDEQLLGVVRAWTPSTTANARIAERYLQMIGLAAVALLATWLLARYQARRLSVHVEDLSKAALRLGDGDFTVEERVVGIPEIDQVRASLNATASRLDALLARERAFSAEASHQLRTPLTGLQLRLEAALRAPGHDHTHAIRASLAEVDRLERTIADLLALARGNRQKGVLDLAGLLTEVHQVWGPRLGSQRRALRFAVEDNLPVVEASTAAIRQVLTVLLGNATEHGEGTVTVAVRDIEEAVAIDVADQGSVAQTEGADLFERREPDADGHGIGLALARRLVEAEGGRLQLSSPSPTTLTVFLAAGRRSTGSTPPAGMPTSVPLARSRP